MIFVFVLFYFTIKKLNRETEKLKSMQRFSKAFLGAFQKLQKATASLIMPVLFVLKTSAPAGLIVMKHVAQKIRNCSFNAHVVGMLSRYSDSLRASNPGGVEIFRTRPYRPRGQPSLLYKGYRVLPGGKAAGAWR